MSKHNKHKEESHSEIKQEEKTAKTMEKETIKEEKKACKEEAKANKKEEKACEKNVAELEKKITELTEKVEAEKNDYLRLMAEFENFRRRTSEEKLALVSSAAAETIKGLLPVLDDCERAMEILETSSDEAAKEGTGLIYNKLMAYLKTKGLEKIEAKGAKFDTDYHEAIAQMPAPEEDKKGYVFDVIKTGYLLNGKVLRFAKVVVGV